MRSLKFETETIQISIYCNIIKQILKRHNELSISKMLVFSYLTKNNNFLLNNVYNANSSQDLIYKGLSLLAGDYKGFCESIEYIIKAIHLLKINEEILIENNIIRAISTIDNSKLVYRENAFLEKTIEASKRMTDKQFIKEVMYNV
ncbi:hypothetical protein MJA45_03925 [Paenibacillus aurantius]|uniref:Uncharacterized protein n=1 Tax=Paenibacillus aurantius TaxID=2918900 RepID=A0AA96RIH7_9BACL|nr:hypothetical protein [Paenibacillus aurantius]WNQ12209.1 hypothetical protein MJA45_03925 [Paenibacillus aurantius]